MELDHYVLINTNIVYHLKNLRYSSGILKSIMIQASNSNLSQALERIGHVDEVINDPEYVLISFSDQLTRASNIIFFILVVM